MIKVSSRFLDRAKGGLRRYQKVLEAARRRDVNESDTCVIVSDFLADVLGYDKYSEVTTEFAIRSTFCDLAIKVDGRLQYLIEVKSVGTDLKENHLRQAVDYGANQGVEWVLLTNGILWQAHRLRFEKPISHEEVFSIDLLNAELKSLQILEKLYLISREAGGSAAISTYWQQKEATSRFVVAQMLVDPTVLSVTRRQLKRLFPGVKIDEESLESLIRNDVLKRELLEGERASAAEKLIKRATRRRQRNKTEEASEAQEPKALTAPVLIPQPAT
jgi:hypothetical protein